MEIFELDKLTSFLFEHKEWDYVEPEPENEETEKPETVIGPPSETPPEEEIDDGKWKWYSWVWLIFQICFSIVSFSKLSFDIIF